MTDLTPEQRAELKAKAEAATPGPWKWRMRADCTAEVGVGEFEKLWCRTRMAEVYTGDADADYMAAASPDVVLKLIAEVKRLRERLEIAEPMLRGAACGVPGKTALREEAEK